MSTVANTVGMVYRVDEDRWYEIPWDQAYFWTEDWQAGERESARERAEGKTEVFDGTNEDLRDWLLGEDTA